MVEHAVDLGEQPQHGTREEWRRVHGRTEVAGRTLGPVEEAAVAVQRLAYGVAPGNPTRRSRLPPGRPRHGAAGHGQTVQASGRFGVAVLAPATTAGALPLALHPVMTFSGTSLDLGRLSGCPFGVTAPAALEAVAEALVLEMGGEPVPVAEQARPLYHAA